MIITCNQKVHLYIGHSAVRTSGTCNKEIISSVKYDFSLHATTCKHRHPFGRTEVPVLQVWSRDMEGRILVRDAPLLDKIEFEREEMVLRLKTGIC